MLCMSIYSSEIKRDFEEELRNVFVENGVDVHNVNAVEEEGELFAWVVVMKGNELEVSVGESLQELGYFIHSHSDKVIPFEEDEKHNAYLVKYN